MTSVVIKTKKTLLATTDVMKKLIKSGEVEIIGTMSKVWLGVPLFSEKRVIGVLAIQSYTNENAYDESDMKLLKFIAGQISISVQVEIICSILLKIFSISP